TALWPSWRGGVRPPKMAFSKFPAWVLRRRPVTGAPFSICSKAPEGAPFPARFPAVLSFRTSAGLRAPEGGHAAVFRRESWSAARHGARLRRERDRAGRGRAGSDRRVPLGERRAHGRAGAAR